MLRLSAVLEPHCDKFWNEKHYSILFLSVFFLAGVNKRLPTLDLEVSAATVEAAQLSTWAVAEFNFRLSPAEKYN